MQHAEWTTLTARIYDERSVHKEACFAGRQITDLTGVSVLECARGGVVQDKHLPSLLSSLNGAVAVLGKQVVVVDVLVIEQSVGTLQLRVRP